MNICENCKQEHDGQYGSGRFCSDKCARGFSTKAKRKNINEKVSRKLKINKPIRFCKICNVEIGSRTQLGYCQKHLYESEEYRSLLRKPHKSGSGGLRTGGGRSKVFEYDSKYAGLVKLNKHEIEVAKIFDSLEILWNRNWKGFRYVDLEGRDRKYYPDF